MLIGIALSSERVAKRAMVAPPQIIVHYSSTSNIFAALETTINLLRETVAGTQSPCVES
jgi:hypothetical protein